MNAVLRSRLGLVVALCLASLPATAAEKNTNTAAAKPGGAPFKIYRLSEVETAKQRAEAEGKPIAWIGGVSEHLAPYEKIMGKGSHAATAYAIRALQREAIICFSDGRTENHTEPPIVDQALHSPNPHYTMPYVIILTPQLDQVLAKVPYTESAETRVSYFAAALKKIRDKASWPEPAEKPKPDNPPAKP